MNSEFRYLPHTTSATRASAIPSPASRSYLGAPKVANNTQNLLTALLADNFSDLELHCPIPTHVNWSEEMQCYLAVDTVFEWHGQGHSSQEAIQDLAEVIAEDFRELRDWPGQLSPSLRQRLTIMKGYFGDAS